MSQDFNSLFQDQQPAATPPPPPQTMAQATPEPALAPQQDVAAFIASTTEKDMGYEQSRYYEEGYYRRNELLSVELKQVEMRTIFIANLMILESSVASRPAGTEVAVVRPIEGKYAKSTAGEVRKYLAAIMGIPWDQLTDETIRKMVVPQQPCAGRLVEVQAKDNKTKTFTNVQMNPVPGDMPEHKAEAARLRQAIGLTPF